MLDTKWARSEIIVAGDDIFIKNFESYHRIFNRQGNRINHSPIETSLTSWRSIMNISLLGLTIKLAFYTQITHIFEIIVWHSLYTPNNDSYFEVGRFFTGNIKLSIKRYIFKWNQIHPKSYQSLCPFRCLMI